MEYWDIYDEKKERTGRTMARNDWHMKPGDYHLTVLALIINETVVLFPKWLHFKASSFI